jgi:hypothetical protein
MITRSQLLNQTNSINPQEIVVPIVTAVLDDKVITETLSCLPGILRGNEAFMVAPFIAQLPTHSNSVDQEIDYIDQSAPSSIESSHRDRHSLNQQSIGRKSHHSSHKSRHSRHTHRSSK